MVGSKAADGLTKGLTTYSVDVDGTTIEINDNGKLHAKPQGTAAALTIGSMTFNGSAARSVTAGNGIEFDPASEASNTIAIKAKADSTGYLTVEQNGIDINPLKVDSGYTTSTTTNIATVATVTAAIGGLDVTEFALASKNGKAITIKGIKEDAGKIAISTTTANDITFADVASTGKAEDISIDDNSNLITATTVEGALAELANAVGAGTASKTVYITETAGSDSDLFSKRYGIYQGSTGSSASPVVGEKLADIDIPKDMVVESGSVVNITFDSTESKLYDGVTDVTAIIKGDNTPTAADAGKYIKLVIANATSDPLYIAAKDLVDIYTAAPSATKVQIAINNNVISATIVGSSIGTTELANSAVTTAKIADDAVTADKVAIAAHTESQTAGTDGLAISVTTTDGQVSAVSGSIAANTYEAYGAVTTAISGLDATIDADAASGVTTEETPTADFKVLNSVTETDGKLTAATAYNLKKVAATANVNDLVQTTGDCLIFNCGSATTVTNPYPAQSNN